MCNFTIIYIYLRLKSKLLAWYLNLPEIIDMKEEYLMVIIISNKHLNSKRGFQKIIKLKKHIPNWFLVPVPETITKFFDEFSR